MHRAGPAAAVVEAGADDALGEADAVAAGVAGLDSLAGVEADDDGDAAPVEPWGWLWVGPQPLSSSAAAAAAVTEVITSLFFICRGLMAPL
ncbi:hypothetical protein [uncultured Arthrobacter sp.]|uniref:hypothetical protein n=1 Tax=uncultured Arthrobacter sp. TaxID=114050 RepID=UPI0032176347